MATTHIKSIIFERDGDDFVLYIDFPLSQCEPITMRSRDMRNLVGAVEEVVRAAGVTYMSDLLTDACKLDMIQVPHGRTVAGVKGVPLFSRAVKTTGWLEV